MMLTEVTGVPQAALPIAALKEHLRLGTGFAVAPDQDGLLESYLRAALAAIEGRTGKALMARDFAWVLEDWKAPAEQALPLGPVTDVVSVVTETAEGVPATVPAAQVRLVADLHRPRIVAAAGSLPVVPTGGRVVVTFTAGFGAAWADVPADLRQAVLLLATEYYEHRHDDGAQAPGLPGAVVALIERWRPVRVLGGGGRR